MAPASVAVMGDEQGIAVLDVPKLMREHAGKFIAVQSLQKPGRDSDGGTLGVAPRGEGVRLWIVHDVDPRHRQLRLSRQLPHEPIKLGSSTFVRLARAIHGEDHFVRPPIGQQVHRRSD